MKEIRRRDALRHLGLITSGASVAAWGSSLAPAARATAAPTHESSGMDDALESGFWDYAALDPVAVATRAYAHYPGHGCMYAVFRGMLETWGTARGSAPVPFPFAMMDYGHGGSGGYGSLCGALNGAAAVISLFEPAQRLRDVLIVDLFKWYEGTAFPVFRPPAGDTVATSVSESVLCHASIARWCGAS